MRFPVIKWSILLLTPVLVSPLLLVDITYAPASRCASVVLLMAVYWTCEALPLPVTSLLPIVLFPLLGILSTNDTALVYMKGTQMLYIGSLIIALAVEESGLHKRLALRALMMSGTSPSSIMLGFMILTAFLSMWISNAATTAMMMPILEAVLNELGLQRKQEKMMMYLSIAYSANVGGTGTLIGTPPNLILMEFLTSQYPDHPLNFGSWMLFSLPNVIMNLFLLWIVLQLYFMGTDSVKQLKFKCRRRRTEETETSKSLRELLRKRYQHLGPMTFHELSTLALFSSVVIIWFLRKPGFISGWSEMLEWTDSQGSIISISSATPTLLIVILFFVIPADPFKDPKGKTLLEWDSVQRKFPWGVILLMGGGFALARGAQSSCLSSIAGAKLSHLESLPPVVILVLVCIVTSVVSQVASNATTTTMMVPVVLALSDGLGLNPLYMALGVTLTASHAFMLPVSTPCNAIVFNAGKGVGLSTRHMAGVGVLLNLVCLATSLLCLHTWAGAMLGLDTRPGWANTTLTSDGGPGTCAELIRV